jgi:OmcA/MtrC family decaheme c-type cytochrome
MGGTNTHSYAGYLPAAGAVVPGAAVITWDVSSVSKDATLHPVIKFKFKKDGTDVVFNTFGAGVTQLMNNFVGSPSAYFAYAVPQDGITAPVDYNATASSYIKNAWNGTDTNATLTGPDATGYYTLTINNKTVPASATLFTGGIGYTYGSATTPLTQTNLPAYPYTAATNVGGLMTVVPNTWKVATGSTARRAIVSNDKCNACHAALGVAPTFHSGQRNDAQTCSFCHTVNRTNSGWAVNAKDIVHSIHGAAKRTNKFSWEVSAGNKYWTVGYPGVLKNCEQCHLTGTYDFSAAASASALPNLLASSTAQGAIPAAILTIVTGTETVPGTYYSPFVTAGANYGLAFNATAVTQDPTYSNNLVISPISAACYSCHDTSAAKAHMVQNGGSINVARSVALGNTETCLVCHGAVSSTNVTNVTTPAIKAVHRWW